MRDDASAVGLMLTFPSVLLFPLSPCRCSVVLLEDAAAETGAMSGTAAGLALEVKEAAAGAALLLVAAAGAAERAGAAAVRAREDVFAAVVAALSCEGETERD